MMELKNLLNNTDRDVEDMPMSQKKALRLDAEALLNLPDGRPQLSVTNKYTGTFPAPGNYNNPTNGDFNGSRPKPQAPSATNPYLQFAPQSPQYKNMGGMHMSMDPSSSSWNPASVNGNVKPYDYNQINLANQTFRQANATPTNGDREIRSIRPTQGVQAALKTIERYRTNHLKSEIPIRDGASLSDFPESPIILNSEIYESTSTWASTWKPDQLEKLYAEIYIRDLKNSRDIKRRVNEFRSHVEDMSVEEDEIWFAREIPMMHQLNCMNSKKNKNCMGCSPFWKCTQTIQEELRPWGIHDLLHYEPSHSETFLGYISMNGSYIPPQREMLACDLANTMYYTDDPNAVTIWGFISPSEVTKLTEEDGLGIQFYDQKTFVDPAFMEKKVKVIYGVQRVGQTVVVPSGWVYWTVHTGRGLSFSASWNFLRLQHVTESRKSFEFNRSLGIYKPVNLPSLLISASYLKIDEFETVDSSKEKRIILDFLLKILPLLKTLVLEELLGNAHPTLPLIFLGEHLTLSAMVVLSYDSIVDKLRKSAKTRLTSSLNSEIMQIRSSPIPSVVDDVIEEDDDLHYSCFQCKQILFNSRRSCQHCKGYDLCEACFGSVGRLHPHKMKKYRKNPVQNYTELTDQVITILQEREEIISKDRELTESLLLTQSQISQREREVKKEIQQQDTSLRDLRELASLSKDVRNSETGNVNKRKKREASMKKDESSSPPPSSSSTSVTGNYDSEVIDCICANNKDLGFMISCEKCFAWLHGKCVGISKRNEPDEYYCPRCVKKNPGLAKPIPKDFSPERKLREYKLA